MEITENADSLEEILAPYMKDMKYLI